MSRDFEIFGVLGVLGWYVGVRFRCVRAKRL